MEHMDGKILDIMNEVKERRSLNILEEVKILGKKYIFKPQNFFDDALTLYVPESFEDMKEEAAKIKYPSESRPQIIKTDASGAINLTLSQLDQEIDDGDIQELKKGIKTAIKNTQPANLFYDDEIIEVQEKKVGYFEFKSYALDGQIFNLMFLLEADKKLVLGTLCCLYKDYKYWRPIFKQMVENIRWPEEES